MASLTLQACSAAKRCYDGGFAACAPRRNREGGLPLAIVHAWIGPVRGDCAVGANHQCVRALGGHPPIDRHDERERCVRKQSKTRLRKGDVVMAPELDRLFRSALDAVKAVEDLRTRGVALHLLESRRRYLVRVSGTFATSTAYGAVADRSSDHQRRHRRAALLFHRDARTARPRSSSGDREQAAKGAGRLEPGGGGAAARSLPGTKPRSASPTARACASPRSRCFGSIKPARDTGREVRLRRERGRACGGCRRRAIVSLGSDRGDGHDEPGGVGLEASRLSPARQGLCSAAKTYNGLARKARVTKGA